MIDLIMYITTTELLIGAVMVAIAWIDPKWLRDKSDTYHNVLTLIALFLVLSAGHNLIGLGIWGLFFV